MTRRCIYCQSDSIIVLKTDTETTIDEFGITTWRSTVLCVCKKCFRRFVIKPHGKLRRERD
jgi:hypothetical protein